MNHSDPGCFDHPRLAATAQLVVHERQHHLQPQVELEGCLGGHWQSKRQAGYTRVDTQLNPFNKTTLTTFGWLFPMLDKLREPAANLTTATQPKLGDNVEGQPALHPKTKPLLRSCWNPTRRTVRGMKNSRLGDT